MREPLFSRVSLRTRLAVAFAALVSLLLVVGVTSYRVHSGIRSQVAVLRPSTGVELRPGDLGAVGLELEGAWDPGGFFLATEVEVIPAQRRPKLRGALQAVDRYARVLTLHGVEVHLRADTAVADPGADPAVLEHLEAGQRVEVTCDVEDGVWIARKVRTRDVKASDKIKGTATSAEVDGVGPESLEFHGLEVVLAAPPQAAPDSALRQLGTATDVVTALQECGVAAHARAARARAASRRLDAAVQDVADALLSPEGALEPRIGAVPTNGWVRRLSERLPELEESAARLDALASSDAAAARAYLAEVFDPLLHELQPVAYGYLSQAREDLGDQLESIEASTATTTRVALATSGVAALVALGLGFLLWRSIHRPVVALHEAAARFGAGQLDARVQLRSRDELGDLADAFDHMAAQLASTTVSIGNLENVFDSMSAALVVLSPDRRITNVNRATLGLLAYTRGELLGLPFEEICLPSEIDLPLPRPGAGTDGAVSVTESELRTRNGKTVPVSFSAAELRPREGSLQGYVCVAQDLTERKRIEAQVRSSLAEKELLLREVHHRVKSNMQVISSMLAMQSSRATDPRLIAGFEQSQARIRSMALIHEQLYQSSDLAHIDLRVYLDLLTRHILQSYGVEGRVRTELVMDDIALDVDSSLACGLIVNELVANSIRHGFGDDRSGTVRIELTERPGELVELAVSDDGRGLRAALDLEQPKTLGLSLVSTLARQLGGEAKVRHARGVEVRILFPRHSLESLPVR